MNDIRYKYVSYERSNPSKHVVCRKPEEGEDYTSVKLANGATIVKKVVLKDFRWSVVKTEVVNTLTGNEICWNTIHTCDSICTVTIIGGKAIFSKTERIILGGTFWECPAGCIDAGESAISAGIRENTEELGIHGSVSNYVGLGSAYLDNGKSDEYFGFAAVAYDSNSSFSDKKLEEGELIGEQILLTPAEVLSGLMCQLSGGCFYDGIRLSGHSYTTLLTLYFWETEIKKDNPSFEGIFFESK